ncbi:MAG TPA: hypothetical protein VHY32_02760 [Caulobacteraceae bacterium]|nr:hypothetical protein [Caulobacteraceae bacterium]
MDDEFYDFVEVMMKDAERNSDPLLPVLKTLREIVDYGACVGYAGVDVLDMVQKQLKIIQSIMTTRNWLINVEINVFKQYDVNTMNIKELKTFSANAYAVFLANFPKFTELGDLVEDKLSDELRNVAHEAHLRAMAELTRRYP